MAADPTSPSDDATIDSLPAADRGRQVQRVLLIEGAVNFVLMGVKLALGLTTGSLSLISDSLHSLGDLVNNFVAFAVARVAAKPPDREHPYGHYKFESLAVLGLAVLMLLLAGNIVVEALQSEERSVTSTGYELLIMLGVLGANLWVALWQNGQARKLDSQLLEADAKHTISDVLTTVAAIAGWQAASRGLPWLDSVLACVVAAIVAFLAVRILRQAVPVLVDGFAIDPAELERTIIDVDGVVSVLSVRSRWIGVQPVVDAVITVDGGMTLHRAHEITDRVEARLEERFGVRDATVHVEPAE